MECVGLFPSSCLSSSYWASSWSVRWKVCLHLHTDWLGSRCADFKVLELFCKFGYTAFFLSLTPFQAANESKWKNNFNKAAVSLSWSWPFCCGMKSKRAGKRKWTWSVNFPSHGVIFYLSKPVVWIDNFFYITYKSFFLDLYSFLWNFSIKRIKKKTETQEQARKGWNSLK